MVTNTDAPRQVIVDQFPLGDNGLRSDTWYNGNYYDLVKGFARAKEQYEQQHPETSAGGKRTAGQRRAGFPPFVDYAAEQFRPKKHRDTISKYARIGADLIDLPPGLENHPILNNLRQLQQLSEQSEPTQHLVAEKLLSGECQTVEDGLALLNVPSRVRQRPASDTPRFSDGNGRASYPTGSAAALRAQINSVIADLRRLLNALNARSTIADELRITLERALDDKGRVETQQAARHPHHEVRQLPPIPRSS